MRVGPTSRNLVIVSMNQRDELSDELISAYIDGELSPDECAHVEQLVAGSDVHRQALADFRGLAGDMQQLPRYRLDEQFAERVAERVRRMAACVTVSSASSSSSAPASAHMPRRSSASAWNWSAVAGALSVCAAALLLAAWIWVPRWSALDSSGAGIVAVAPEAGKEDPAKNAAIAQAAPSSPDALATDSSVPATAPSAMGQPVALPDPAAGSADRPEPPTLLVESAATPGNITDRQLPAPGPMSSNPLLVGDSDVRTPGSAARMNPVTPLEPQADSEKLTDVPFTLDQQLLFVFEISLTRKGAEQLAFEQVLMKHHVAVDGAVPVDLQLELSLLESRYFDPVELDTKAQDRPRQPTCSLVYAQIRAGQVDEIWRSMQANPGSFAGMSFDLAILPADRTLFENLRQAISRIPAAQSDLAAGEGRRPQAARRLTLPPQWRGRPANPPPRRSEEADFPPDTSDAETPVVEGRASQPQPGLPTNPSEKLGEDLDAEVLFVLHLGPA